MAFLQFVQALFDLRCALQDEQSSTIYEDLFHHVRSNHSSLESGDDMEGDNQEVYVLYNRFISDLATLCSIQGIQTAATSLNRTHSNSLAGDQAPNHWDAFAGQIPSPQKRSRPRREYLDGVNILSDDTTYDIDLQQPSFHRIGAPVSPTAAAYLNPPSLTTNACAPHFFAPPTSVNIQPAQVIPSKAWYLRTADKIDGSGTIVPISPTHNLPSAVRLSDPRPKLLTNDQHRERHCAGPSRSCRSHEQQINSAAEMAETPDIPDSHVTLSQKEYHELQGSYRQLRNIQFHLALQTPLDGIFGTIKSETSSTQQLKCRLNLPAIDVADYAQKLRDMLLDRMATFSQEAKRHHKTTELCAALKVSGEIARMGLETVEAKVPIADNKRGRPKKEAKKMAPSIAPVPALALAAEDGDDNENVTPAKATAGEESEEVTPTPTKNAERRTNVPRNKAKVRDRD